MLLFDSQHSVSGIVKLKSFLRSNGNRKLENQLPMVIWRYVPLTTSARRLATSAGDLDNRLGPHGC